MLGCLNMKHSSFVLAVQFILILKVASLERVYVENRKLGEETILKTPPVHHPLLRTLKNYEMIQPVQYEDYHHQSRKASLSTEIKNQIGLHARESYFTIDFDGKTFILDVSINEELLPESYKIMRYSENGDLVMHKPSKNEQNHCYYQGHVRGTADSRVIMSTCHGLKGTIILPDDIVVFEPLILPNQDVSYVAYRSKDTISDKPEGVCGNPSPLQSFSSVFKSDKGYTNETKSRPQRNVLNEKKFLELLLVADNALITRLGSSNATEVHVKEVANHLDSFFQKLGIRVILSGVELWADSDKSSTAGSATQVLDAFLKYRGRQISSQPASSPWVYADNVHMLHGGDFAGFVVAMASVGTMCGPLSGGVSEDLSNNLIRVAATVAHEIGHNFAIEHDSGGCVCPPASDCIMAGKAGSGNVKDWTDCSKNYLTQSGRLGLLNCLVNVPSPSRIFSGAECGNDIIEQGEECDCGKPAFCKSLCCNAATCQLKTGAVCDDGLCCNNCRYASAGKRCRAAANECDFPEYCSGNSPNCPSNTFQENGLPCLNGAATCDGGVCLTYDLQCQNIWGETATNAIPTCYNFVNTYGNANGNCGRDAAGTGFVECSAENVNCGKLLCLGGGNKPIVGDSRVSFTNGFREDATATSGPIFNCKSLKSLDGSDSETKDPGLVRAGTVCASGKWCQSGVCETFRAPTCSASCNGKGKCNNLGQCHCDAGFAPPNCRSSGNGGSISSGNSGGRPSSDDETGDTTDGGNSLTTSGSKKASADLQLVLTAVLVALFCLSIQNGGSNFCSYSQCGSNQSTNIRSRDRCIREEPVSLTTNLKTKRLF